MLEYARWEFEFSKRGDDGQKSQRETLEDIYEQTGVLSEVLIDAPECPDITSYLWLWFIELSRHRQSGMGLSPLAYSDIESFFRLKQLTPAAWELRCISLLDCLYLEVQNSKEQVIQTASDLKVID